MNEPTDNDTAEMSGVNSSDLLDDLLALLKKIHDNPEMDVQIGDFDTAWGKLAEVYTDCGGDKLFCTFPSEFI